MAMAFKDYDYKFFKGAFIAVSKEVSCNNEMPLIIADSLIRIAPNASVNTAWIYE